MRRKYRLASVFLISMLMAILLMIIVSTSLYAASNAYILGNGNLTVDSGSDLPVEEQKGELKDFGLHATGSEEVTLAQMEPFPTTDTDAAIKTARDNAIESGFLSYEFYKKIDCSHDKNYIYEMQVVLDFSNYNIAVYSKYCLLYYNQIAFYENLNNIIIYDFYTGEVVDTEINPDGSTNLALEINKNSYNLTLKAGNKNYAIQFTYKIILNNLYAEDGNLKSISLNNLCFKMNEKENQGVVVPEIVYIDISEKEFAYAADKSIVGITFGSSGGIEKTDLTDKHHIHVIGKNDLQYEVGLSITMDYISSHSEYEVSIYKKEGINKYAILCQVNSSVYAEGTKVDFVIVDGKNYADDILVVEQREAIVNAWYWLSKNIVLSDIRMYHQKVDENRHFLGSALEVTYRETTIGAVSWNEVYYIESGNIIGYFNESGIDIEVSNSK